MPGSIARDWLKGGKLDQEISDTMKVFASTMDWAALAHSDAIFMEKARHIGERSICGSRKIGAVLVHNLQIIGAGFNGPAFGMPACSDRYRETYRIGEGCKVKHHTTADGEVLYRWPLDNFCPRRVLNFPSGEGLHLCVAGHAERNAILNAARKGNCTDGSTLYAYCGVPCKDCATEIVNAGVREVVCLNTGLPDYDDLGRYILAKGKVNLRFMEPRG